MSDSTFTQCHFPIAFTFYQLKQDSEVPLRWFTAACALSLDECKKQFSLEAIRSWNASLIEFDLSLKAKIYSFETDLRRFFNQKQAKFKESITNCIQQICRKHLLQSVSEEWQVKSWDDCRNWKIMDRHRLTLFSFFLDKSVEEVNPIPKIETSSKKWVAIVLGGGLLLFSILIFKKKNHITIQEEAEVKELRGETEMLRERVVDDLMAAFAPLSTVQLDDWLDAPISTTESRLKELHPNCLDEIYRHLKVLLRTQRAIDDQITRRNLRQIIDFHLSDTQVIQF